MDTAVAAEPPPDTPRSLPARDPVGTAMRAVGELLVTAGLVALLFVVYELWITDVLSDQRQAALADELRTEWRDDTPVAAESFEVAVGEPFAFLHVPRLGAGWKRAVVEGTGQAELADGPGHYVDTGLPGQPGNLSIAGHRVGKGSPFLDLDTLRPGDPLVVETAGAWYVYRVLGDPATGDLAVETDGVPGREIVPPEDVSVIAPVPGDLSATPETAYLTLTTCHPKYSARERLVIHAVLDGSPVSRASAPDGPTALHEEG